MGHFERSWSFFRFWPVVRASCLAGCVWPGCSTLSCCGLRFPCRLGLVDGGSFILFGPHALPLVISRWSLVRGGPVHFWRVGFLGPFISHHWSFQHCSSYSLFFSVARTNWGFIYNLRVQWLGGRAEEN
ncbi:MAG: hypothetical protein JOS17DRAFT_732565 [Linnemannia elongata]|nr:MAG: hypothetical protein JOS17DRAFT_732565 [Linnemannia elongata]